MNATLHGKRTNLDTNDHVVDSLLAFAKDNRYINDLSMLLQKAIYPHIQIHSNATTQQELGEDSTLQPEIDLLSRLIYALILLSEGGTIGLEHLGISYQNEGSKRRLHLYATLFALAPYFIERVGGKEGWKGLSRVRRRRILQADTMAMREGRGLEQLRGQDRRRVHEQMRRRMMEHSAGGQDQFSAREPQSQRSRIYRRASMGLSYQYICQCLKKILASMKAATNSSMPIAHEIPESSVSSTVSVDNHNSTSYRMGNLFKWIIRLNLALFYVNGKYFSILHRLTGIKIGKRHDSIVSIVTERPEYKLIGLMIIVQAGAKGIQAATEILLTSWFSTSQNAKKSAADLKLESKVPSKYSRKNGSRELIVSTQGNVQCGICMAERRHPAAPVSCGHVFCWSCIHHWIASVRHECPLCRSPTSPKDVIALHNYFPS